MDNYKDFFIDIDKFNPDNMIYLKPIMFYKICRNMGVYYKKNPKAKRQKIIVQTPKMVLPFGVKKFDNNGKKSYQIALSFTTLTNLYNEDEIKKFYQFIQKIDRTNEETILQYRRKWGLPKNLGYRKTLQKISKNYPHHINLNLPLDEAHGFLFNVYDEKATKSTIDILDKKSIVSVVMELTDLRFTDKEFRSNWTVMQIRKFKPYSPIQDFFMSGCFIVDPDDPQDKVEAKPVAKTLSTIPIVVGQAIQQKPNAEEKQPATVSFQPPSLEELLSAKSSLKKTKTVIKGMLQNDVPVPPPPDKKHIK